MKFYEERAKTFIYKYILRVFYILHIYFKTLKTNP